jgi:hypothetical protein
VEAAEGAVNPRPARDVQADTEDTAMSLSQRLRLGLLVVCAALAARAAPAALAGEEPPADASDAVVAAYLEGLNVRMRAKADEARLYEAAGDRERALAALREIGEVQRAGEAAVARLLARRAPAAAPPRPAERLPGVTGGPILRPAPREPVAVREREAARDGVLFLLRAQRPDGFVDPALARAEGDPAPEPGREAAVTAVAVLAWLDAAWDLGRAGDDASVDAALARSAEAAAARGADALVTSRTKDGRLGGDDVEDGWFATWALAAAQSRFGRADWRGALDRAIDVAIEAQADDGWWGGAGDDRDAAAVRAAIAVTALHEAMPVLRSGERFDRAREALRRAEARALALPAGTVGTGRPLAVVARALLVRGALAADDPAERRAAPAGLVAAADEAFASRLVPPEGEPAKAVGSTTLAFGTAYAFGSGERAWRRWRERVLLPALAQRETRREVAGSWSPVGDPRAERNGRAFSTALHVLAALHGVVPFVPPKGT